MVKKQQRNYKVVKFKKALFVSSLLHCVRPGAQLVEY